MPCKGILVGSLEMILTEVQLKELHRRLKLTSIPNWKSLPGLETQVIALKNILSDVFIRKQNEAF